MILSLVSWLEIIGVYALIGAAFTILERMFPVRTFSAKREHLLDVLTVFYSFGLKFLFGAFVGTWIVKVALLPGMGWMGRAHAFLASCPVVVGGIAFFLISDFLAYWAHRLNHTRLLWSTHAFHHSAEHLNWASGMRESPVHKVLLLTPSVIAGLIAPTNGFFATIVIAYGIAHNSFIHSNVRIKGRWINWLFVTGEWHFVHHAKDLHYGNMNFGFLLTIWDRIFGTFADPATLPKDYPLGLPYEIGIGRLALGLPARASSEEDAPIAGPQPEAATSTLAD